MYVHFKVSMGFFVSAGRSITGMYGRNMVASREEFVLSLAWRPAFFFVFRKETLKAFFKLI